MHSSSYVSGAPCGGGIRRPLPRPTGFGCGRPAEQSTGARPHICCLDVWPGRSMAVHQRAWLSAARSRLPACPHPCCLRPSCARTSKLPIPRCSRLSQRPAQDQLRHRAAAQEGSAVHEWCLVCSGQSVAPSAPKLARRQSVGPWATGRLALASSGWQLEVKMARCSVASRLEMRRGA